MKNIIVVSASILTTALATENALAESSWDGPYVGLSVGYADGKLKGADSILNEDALYYGIPSNPKPSGTEFGLFAGYNHTLLNNDIIGGIEVAYDTKTIDDSTTAPSGTFPRTADTSIKNRASFTAKLGYAISGSLMPYMNFGGVVGKTYFNVSPDGNINSDFTPAYDKKTTWGTLVGVGVDYKVSSNCFLRTSYNQIKFDKTNYFNPLFLAPKQHFILDEFKIGVGYSF